MIVIIITTNLNNTYVEEVFFKSSHDIAINVL